LVFGFTALSLIATSRLAHSNRRAHPELERLRAERDAALTEAERAKAAAAEAEAARLGAEKEAKGATEERALMEELPAEAEAAKVRLAQQVATLQTAARGAVANERLELSAPRARTYPAPPPERAEAQGDEFRLAQELVGLQAEAAASSAAEQQEVLQLAQAAAEQIDLDEADTRALIDERLRERGWEADTQKLRYANGARPARGKAMAIAEWPSPRLPRKALVLVLWVFGALGLVISGFGLLGTVGGDKVAVGLSRAWRRRSDE
jgi:type I restriction enzyme R subunit